LEIRPKITEGTRLEVIETQQPLSEEKEEIYSRAFLRKTKMRGKGGGVGNFGEEFHRRVGGEGTGTST